MGVSKFLKSLFDRKISDRTTVGYNAEKIKSWLSNIKEIDNFRYYYYPPGSKFPAQSKDLKNQPPRDVLSFLEAHFSESSNLFTEIQHKVYRSGKQEIILRGINLNGEITKIAVLNFRKPIN